MFRVPSISGQFKWRQFEPEVILVAVGWYLRFSLFYLDVEELLAERGLHADHVTVWRWVQGCASEMERRCDLLKVDCEGGELAIFQSLDSKTAKSIGTIVYEPEGSVYDVPSMNKKIAL